MVRIQNSHGPWVVLSLVACLMQESSPPPPRKETLKEKPLKSALAVLVLL